MRKTNHWLFVLLLLCLAGCSTASNNGEKNANTPAPTMSASDIFQTEETETTPGVVDKGTSEVLGEELEKTDATEQAKYNTVNRMLKHALEQSQSSMFCIDGETGVVYFVNQKQDYYIYRLKDGVAELAVSIPAKYLYCQDGILYFMVDSYNQYVLQGMQAWDIYAYNPAKGTVDLLYPLGKLMENVNPIYLTMQKMRVDENGIYFLGNIEVKQIEINGVTAGMVETESYCLPFGTTEPVTDDKNMTKAGWGEYYFIIDAANGMSVSLVNRVTESTSDIIQVGGYAYNYCLLGDEVYLLEGKKISKVNLITGERTEYDCEPILREKVAMYADEKTEVPQLITFTITKDGIWAFDSAGYVVRFDRRTGEASCYKLSTNIAEESVYTDGYSVYVLTSAGVAKVLTEEAKENSNGIPVLEVEYLVK